MGFSKKEGGNVESRQTITGKVVAWHDLLRARLGSFQRKVNRALQLIEQARALGTIGVSFSGGKDSTVLLDLVRRVIPDAPAAFFDSGAELADTLAFVRDTDNIDVIPAIPSLIECCKQGGYWGHESDTPDITFDFGEILITVPARKFAERHNLAVSALGLRAQESSARHLNACRSGTLYKHSDGLWRLCPLAFWDTDDIWAYIASRELPYNVAYDKMAALGMTRETMRISCVLGASAAGFGRYAYLRQIDPVLWNRLAADFPKVRAYV